MRTLLLVSTAILLAACSDNPQATAPRSIGSATTGSGAGDRRSGQQDVATLNAKPVDQVGFTKITESVGPGVQALPFSSDIFTNAYCPQGTTLVGGGYRIDPNYAAYQPIITASHRDINPSAWRIDGIYPFALGGLVQVYAIAYCAS